MKDWTIKELDDFIRVTDSIENNPFKFYEIIEPEKKGEIKRIRAECWLRTALISWEGEHGEDRIKLLKDHTFSEAKLKETKKIVLAELI